MTICGISDKGSTIRCQRVGDGSLPSYRSKNTLGTHSRKMDMPMVGGWDCTECGARDPDTETQLCHRCNRLAVLEAENKLLKRIIRLYCDPMDMPRGADAEIVIGLGSEE